MEIRVSCCPEQESGTEMCHSQDLRVERRTGLVERDRALSTKVAANIYAGG